MKFAFTFKSTHKQCYSITVIALKRMIQMLCKAQGMFFNLMYCENLFRISLK